MSPKKRPQRPRKKQTMGKVQKPELEKFIPPEFTPPNPDIAKIVEENKRALRRLGQQSIFTEKLGSYGERKGTAKHVAEWMLREIKDLGHLYQAGAAKDIYQEFGGGFLYENNQGNRAIDSEVLKEFRKLTEKTVVWDRREKMWRWRQPGDPLGRRQV